MRPKRGINITNPEKASEDFFISTHEDLGEISDDGDLDDKSHNKLLSDISSISTNKKKITRRKVRTTVGTGSAAVSTQDLLKRIQVSGLQQSVTKLKTLPAPLEKPEEQRVKRNAGFEKVKKDVNKWEKIVDIRRKAEHLAFPLEKATPVDDDSAAQPNTETDLEKEVYSLLQGVQEIPKKKTPRQKAIERAMSLKEQKEKLREMLREKEMKRRFEDRARRLNKSKSKKFRRILKHEKLRKQKTELSELEKTDPDLALERLEQMEKMRIEERMTQRHRVSKWSKFQGLRATKDKDAMEALKENARLHRELKMKWAKKKNESDDEEDERDMEDVQQERDEEAGSYDPMNPWTASLAKRQAPSAFLEKEDDSFTKFKMFWEEVNERKIQDKEAQLVADAYERETQLVEAKEKELVEAEEKGQDKNMEQESDDMNEESDGEDLEPDQMPDKKSLTAIDYMFEEAEGNLKKKVKRKLEKIGISIEEEKKWTEVKKQKLAKEAKKPGTVDATVVEEFDFSSKMNDKNIEVRQRVRTLDDIEELTQRQTKRRGINEAFATLTKEMDTTDSNKVVNETTSVAETAQSKKVEVDPTKFIKVGPKKILTAMPDKASHGSEGLDDSEEEEEEDAEDIIREAFADDYLIDEFKSQKKAALKEDEVDDLELDTELPGWGSWTGPNMKKKKPKEKKKKLRRGKNPYRKDFNAGHVIYNEKADVHKKLRETMVSELPKHFSTVKDFEASIRAPTGRTFVPEKVHRKLTKPEIKTKAGAVIEPMSKEELLTHS